MSSTFLPKTRILLSFALLGGLAAGTATAQQPGAAAQKPGAAAQNLSPEERQAQARERIVKRIWWNQERKLEKVSISDETRAQMDAVLVAFLDKRDSMREDRQVEDFADALEAGSREAAEKAARAQTDLNAEVIHAQMKMMIDVVMLLSDEQRAKIKEEFPMLFRRDWVPGVGMMARSRAERARAMQNLRRRGGG